MNKASSKPAGTSRRTNRRSSRADRHTTVVDTRGRVAMPPGLRPNTKVIIQKLSKDSWVVRRHRPENDFKVVMFPVIEKLQDDPDWEATEGTLASHCADRLPPPEED